MHCLCFLSFAAIDLTLGFKHARVILGKLPKHFRIFVVRHIYAILAEGKLQALLLFSNR